MSESVREFLELMREVFRVNGYEVRNDEIFDFLAVNEKEELGIVILERIGPKELSRIKRLDGKILLITPGRIPENVREEIERSVYEIWDRERLEREIGRAILKELFGEEEIEERGNYVKLCVSEQDAMWICRSLFGRCDGAFLRYVPFWIYEYEVRGFREHDGEVIKISGGGTGALNAVTGENYWINMKGAERSEKAEGEVLQPEIDYERALREVKKRIKERHVVRRNFNRVVRDSLISEVRKFHPEDEEIELEMELLYIPVWEVRYRDRRIELNGYNGEPFEEIQAKDVEFI